MRSRTLQLAGRLRLGRPGSAKQVPRGGDSRLFSGNGSLDELQKLLFAVRLDLEQAHPLLRDAVLLKNHVSAIDALEGGLLPEQFGQLRAVRVVYSGLEGATDELGYDIDAFIVVGRVIVRLFVEQLFVLAIERLRPRIVVGRMEVVRRELESRGGFACELLI